jgi:hypothetical protein
MIKYTRNTWYQKVKEQHFYCSSSRAQCNFYLNVLVKHDMIDTPKIILEWADVLTPKREKIYASVF